MLTGNTRSEDEVVILVKGDLGLSRHSSGRIQKPFVVHNYGPVQGVLFLAVYRSIVDSEEVINKNLQRRQPNNTTCHKGNTLIMCDKQNRGSTFP